METPGPEATPPAKTNQRIMLIVAAALLLCCGCLAAVALGFYGWISIREVRPEEIPTSEFQSVVTQEVMTAPPASNPGEPPTGGLGNYILRNDTWRAVAAAAVAQGCDQPVGQASNIEVLQEPDGGIWKEKWTVACASGETYPYEVEFILDETGATFNIKSLP